jgi:predicted esterase
MTHPACLPKLLSLVLLAAVQLPQSAGAEEASPRRLVPGKLAEGIACTSDPTQTYSLYLPSGYTPERRWPALLVFDPRGRSVLAAEIFQSAAEEYSWMILSSDNTRSDGPWEPNDRALKAVWPELFERWSVDPHRIYAAGFSGGAMAALALAEMTHQLAGIISVGGRIPDGLKITETSYAHFGAAGLTDFNYSEMWKLDQLLAKRGNTHRMEVFEGRHQWLPENLARLGVEWLEMEAIRRGTRPMDEALVDRLFTKEMDAARELETAGRGLEALWRYETISRTFGALRDIGEVVHKVAALEGNRTVIQEGKDRQHWDAWEKRYSSRLARGNTQILDPSTDTSLRQLLGTFGINDLKKRAAKEGYEGVVAQRILERIWTHTSFYMTRDLMAQKRYRDALTTLSVAVEIRDDSSFAWYNLACAAARAGSKNQALEALTRAIDLGFRNAAHVTQDEDLRSLHNEPRYLELIAGLDN